MNKSLEGPFSMRLRRNCRAGLPVLTNPPLPDGTPQKARRRAPVPHAAEASKKTLFFPVSRKKINKLKVEKNTLPL
ncbi:MAG: hypothetical protein H6581_19870 [Bacteroidia bacterium]|nr:hypothetical protein [Bacteroidia bacterium]